MTGLQGKSVTAHEISNTTKLASPNVVDRVIDLDFPIIGRESMLYDGKAPQRIKELREKLGISQRKLAKMAGVDSSMISQVEAGERRLTRVSGEKIADALEVGSAWLLYGNEEMKDFPINRELIGYLWEHKDERQRLWEKMKADREG